MSDSHFEVYERSDGAVDLQDSVVCFLDVLGISDFLVQHGQLAAELLDRGLRRARGLESRPFAITAIHDSITIAMRHQGPRQDFLDSFFFNIVQILQASLAVHAAPGMSGMFTRGYVTAGLHFQDAEFVGGPALATAVKAEADKESPWRHRPVARLDPSMHAIIGPHDSPGQVARCDDGYFVNYIAGYCATPATPAAAFAAPGGPWPDVVEGLIEHRELLAQNLSTAGETVIQKYDWLAGYHNAFCIAVGAPNETLVPDVEADPSITFTW
ncbi:MAG: hypothetical protein JO246_01795 [Frankiaceae bacterium]|nr:hypothetical protein [Frankiaceae bacterium]MBV9871510.1 hypothetical protein [Frankiaceae bacterium]